MVEVTPNFIPGNSEISRGRDFTSEFAFEIDLFCFEAKIKYSSDFETFRRL